MVKIVPHTLDEYIIIPEHHIVNLMVISSNCNPMGVTSVRSFIAIDYPRIVIASKGEQATLIS